MAVMGFEYLLSEIDPIKSDATPTSAMMPHPHLDRRHAHINNDNSDATPTPTYVTRP